MSTPIEDIFSRLLSARLRLLRSERSKADFARFLGLSAPVYQRYEAGRIPAKDKLLEIAKRCRVDPDWLIGREEAERSAGVKPLEPCEGLSSPQAKLRHYQFQTQRTPAEVARDLDTSEAEIEAIIAGDHPMPPSIRKRLDAIYASGYAPAKFPENLSAGHVTRREGKAQSSGGDIGQISTETLRAFHRVASDICDWGAAAIVASEMARRGSGETAKSRKK